MFGLNKSETELSDMKMTLEKIDIGFLFNLRMSLPYSFTKNELLGCRIILTLAPILSY